MTKSLLLESIREKSPLRSKAISLKRIEPIEDSIGPEKILNIKLDIYQLEENRS